MTFLKKYGLSAVSLNLLCSVLAIEVFTLTYGFFHLHCEDPKVINTKKHFHSNSLFDFSITMVIQSAPAASPILISILSP